MTTLHTINILSTSIIWNALTVLEFPHMLSTFWLLFLHSAAQIGNLLGSPLAVAIDTLQYFVVNVGGSCGKNIAAIIKNAIAD